MIMDVNKLFKAETPRCYKQRALLAQRPMKEERMSIVSLFYHVSVVPQSEQSLKTVGIGS